MLHSKTFVVSRAAMLLALLGAACAAHADTIYAFATGTKSGVIKGAVYAKGHEGATEVLRLQHEIVTARDAATGMATGKRQHKPLVLTHAFGSMAIQFMAAAATNEVLKDVTIQVWSPDLQGREVLRTTFKLTNASVASVSLATTGTARALQVLQDVSFTYQKIEITDNPSGIVMQDDFNPRL